MFLWQLHEERRWPIDCCDRRIATPHAISIFRGDEAGNEILQIDALNRTNIFGYDSMNRKIAHRMPAGQSEGWPCDFDGNQVVETNFDGAVLTNLYDSMNRLTNTDKHESNGNTTNSSNNVYQYDVMNHLTNAWVNGAQILMTYDGDGDRVSKTVGTVTTYYLLDSQNPSGYSQVLEEWTNTAMARVYNYGLDLINQRQPGISTNYFLFDGHGSTRMLTDIGGTVVNLFVYDAFGNLIASNGAPQTAYLYSGQQWDPDLDLYLNRARYLNPNTGRFWTMDGDYGNNEDPLSLHKYLYAECDPVNNDDPSGNASLMSMILAPLDPIFAAIYSSPSGPKPAVGSLAPNISLSTTEPALILERLFLAEVRSPQNANFSLSEAVTSIHAMGSVIYDRCEANWLGYKHLGYPKDPLHVVTQAGQFQGFQGYTQGAPNGNLPSKIVTRINGELNGANNGADPHYQSYFVIVSEAISTAQNVISGKIYYEDPFKPIRPFGWMGSYAKRGPGGRFYPIGTLAGNTFYGIR